MNYRVEITKEADADLDDILEYISNYNPLVAINFINKLKSKIHKLLSTFPKAGKPFGDLRKISFDNYLIVYEINENQNIVYILLITESHRLWQNILEKRI